MPNLALFPAAAALLALGVPAHPVPRQNLEAATDHGHRSVFSVEVTYADGTKRKETMASMSTGGTEFVLMGTDPPGAEHQLWLDTIADVDVLAPEKIKLTLKDGRKMDLTREAYYAINTAAPGDESAEVRFEKVRHIRFLRPVRRDGLGNAIFDGWTYSPYTGEKLP